MLVEKVDIERIKALLQSLPDKMEITSIDLSNGYSCKLVAGEQQLTDVNFERSLKMLNDTLAMLNERDKLLLK